MAEVEAQIVGRYERAFLLYVRSEYAPQAIVQQVGGGVVALALLSAHVVNLQTEGGFRVGGEFRHDMHSQVVLAACINDGERVAIAAGEQRTRIAYLSAHFAVERCAVEDHLIERLVLLLYFAVTQYVGFAFCLVVADEVLFAFCQTAPVAIFYGGGVACALLLLLHLCVETGFIDAQPLLRADELREVEGEAVGVEEGEGFLAGHRCPSVALRLGNDAFQQVDARREGAEE